MNKIKILKDELVYQGKFKKMIKRYFLNTATNKEGAWEMVERGNYGNVVAIVALTPAKEVVLVKIFRIPLKKYVIEMCAGLNDKKGESELSLAKRELLEETGYKAKKWKKLYQGAMSTGIMKDEMTVFLALDAIQVQEPVLENAEDIEVIKVPINKLRYYLLHPPKGVKVSLSVFGIIDFLKDYE